MKSCEYQGNTPGIEGIRFPVIEHGHPVYHVSSKSDQPLKREKVTNRQTIRQTIRMNSAFIKEKEEINKKVYAWLGANKLL